MVQCRTCRYVYCVVGCVVNSHTWMGVLTFLHGRPRRLGMKSPPPNGKFITQFYDLHR